MTETLSRDSMFTTTDNDIYNIKISLQFIMFVNLSNQSTVYIYIYIHIMYPVYLIIIPNKT